MKKIGLVVAVELAALRRRYGAPEETICLPACEILKYSLYGCELFVLQSGAGEIAAAAATQTLICRYAVDAILNFGVVGGLTEEISQHRTCVVRSVVHYQMDTSQADADMEPGRYLEYPTVFIPADRRLRRFALEQNPALREVVCASGDRFVGDPAEKEMLHRRFQADICDMEAAGILLTCNRNRVPCLLLKMVSDGLSGGAEEFFQTFQSASDACVAILDELLREI